MSRSLRVSDVLFDSANTAGAMFSRSAAQQVEHWARLGKALEAAGLTVDAAAQLFGLAKPESEEALWRHKRTRQAKDVKDVASGRVNQADMYLFTPETARKAKVLNGPY
jgi:hypothetical protein